MRNLRRRTFIAGAVAAAASMKAAGFASAAITTAAPPLTEQELGDVLTSLGEHFTQRASLATNNPTRAFSSGRIASSYRMAYADKELAVMDNARAIAGTHEGYSHASSKVRLVSSQQASDGSVQLTVQEITTLAFAKVIDPRNDDMSYAAEHVVTLTRSQGAWSIQAIAFKPEYKAFIPITQLPEDVPAGTPDHPVGAPSEFAPITFASPEEQGPQIDKLTDSLAVPRGSSIASAAQAAAGYDYSAMVAYAKQYYGTGGPGYPIFGFDDCTNFVSQCLFAGGWEMTPTGRGHPSNDHYWYCYQLPYNPYNPVWPAWDNSHSWSVAQDLRNFAYLSGRAYDLSHVKYLGLGDILGFDYEGDGTLDHMEICSGNRGGDPLMVNRQIGNAYFNKPLSEIRSRYPNARLWPQRT